jgi:hypothetical protein
MPSRNAFALPKIELGNEEIRLPAERCGHPPAVVVISSPASDDTYMTAFVFVKFIRERNIKLF